MKLASALEAVTVYARGAVCERAVTVPAGAGPKITVTGLPLSLKPGSLRARTRGEGPTVLELRPGFDVALGEAIDAGAEQQALEAAEAEHARLSLAAARVQKELDDVAALAPRYRDPKEGDPPREAPVDATLALAGFIAEALPPLQAERRALEEKLKDASNELQLRRRRLAEASSAANRGPVQVDRTAEITLSAAPQAPLALVVEYQVPGARWAPAYELKLGAGLSGGLLALRAAVAQCTGEDWSGVRLSLSTADLDRRIEKPLLRSLRIGRSQPAAPRSGWRDAPAGLDALFADFDALGRPRLPPAPAIPPALKGGKKSRAERKAAAAPAPTPEVLVNAERARQLLPQAAAEPMDEEAGAVDELAPPAPPPPRAPTGAFRPMAPPSMSMAAPMPAPARMAPKMARARGFSFGGGAREEALEVDSSVELAAGAAPGGGGAWDAPAPPPEPELTVDEALLDYDLLRMPGPLEARRGRLQPGSIVAFQAVSLHVQLDVLMAVITTHETAAHAVDRLVLPPHARPPRDAAGSFDYRYVCSAPADVPSVAAWRVVPVATADVAIAAEYQCVPSVEPKVYRTVSLKNRSEYALLSGPVDVFVGGGFLLTAQLPTLAPQGDAETLGLGVEEAIKVARNTAFRETTGGLLGGSTVLPHEVTIDVENRTGRAAQIEVRERVPVTGDDDVKVEEVKVEPMWKKDEGPRDGRVVRGARSWRITVGPGEKKSLFAEFHVRIPSSRMLQGGNRRV